MREISSQLSLMHSAMAFPWSPPTAMMLFVADRELAYLCSLAWKNGSTIKNPRHSRPLPHRNEFASHADWIAKLREIASEKRAPSFSSFPEIEIGPHLVDGAWSRVDDVEVVHVQILSISLWPAHGIHGRSPVCEVSDISLINSKQLQLVKKSTPSHVN